MGVIKKQENWDSVVDPNLPTGFTFDGAWESDNTQYFSVANSLFYALAGTEGLVVTDDSDNSGGVQSVSAYIRFSS